jgi:ABC-2 type transport system ATP-binding protein
VATAIEISGVTRRYGSTVAIDGLSLDVAAGEIFALVGPDGAGKTTLIRLICGALSLDAGELRVDGQDVVRQTSRVQSTIGYMPQRFSLYPDLSVMENLRFYGDIFGVTRADFGPRAQSLLNEFALAPFGERLAEELSGGMKQKLALACTLIHSQRASIQFHGANFGVFFTVSIAAERRSSSAHRIWTKPSARIASPSSFVARS